MKKTLLSILLVAMILTSFAACGPKDVTTSVGTLTGEEIKEFEAKSGGIKLPIDKNGTEIHMFAVTDIANAGELLAIKELSRRTGLDIKVTGVSSSMVTEKVKTMVAGGLDTIPDIHTTGIPLSEINEYGQQGAYYPINKHLDIAPNFKELFVDRAEELQTQDVMVSKVAADGNLYVFPTFNITRNVNYGMHYRKDIFDKHGLKMWTNEKEAYETLKKLKELYPNSYPLTTSASKDAFFRFGPQWGIPTVEYANFSYNYDENKWEHSLVSKRAKNMIFDLKKYYDEEILDIEFYTLTAQAWTQNMSKPDYNFVSWAWIGKMEVFDTSVEGEHNLRYAYPIGPSGKIEPNVSGSLSSGVSIKNGKNAELSLKLCDYLLSEGGAELMTLGIEGVTYKLREDGTAEYLEFDKNPNFTELSNKYGMFLQGVKMRTDNRSCYFQFNEKEQEAQDMMMNKEGGGFLKLSPSIYYTNEEQEMLIKDSDSIRKAFEEFAIKFIYSDIPQDKWEAEWAKWENSAYSKFNIKECINLAESKMNK